MLYNVVSFFCLGDCFDILSGPAEMPSVAEMPGVHFRQIEKGSGVLQAMFGKFSSLCNAAVVLEKEVKLMSMRAKVCEHGRVDVETVSVFAPG